MEKQIQRYCLVDDAVVVERLSNLGQASELDNQRELQRFLGLKSQVVLSHSSPSELEAAKFYPLISDYELVILSGFFQRYYSRNQGHWSGYDFDLIPTRVLEDIQVAISLKLFDDIEIWTPETPFVDPIINQIRQALPVSVPHGASDPIAVGVVGSRARNNSFGSAQFFSIVRWGEALKPFEHIESIVLDRYYPLKVTTCSGRIYEVPLNARLFGRKIISNHIKSIGRDLGSILHHTNRDYDDRGKRHCGFKMFIFRGRDDFGRDTDLESFQFCTICGFCETLS